MKKSDIRAQFFKYVLLNIIGSLGVSVYILIDTFFIERGMGTDGIASLNLCLPVFNFMNGFGLMLGLGGGGKFSMLYCRVERKETDTIFVNAFLTALGISACFLSIGLFFSRPFTAFLGADSSIFEMSHSYLRTILLFSPAFILNQLFICFLRNDAAPGLAMAGVLGGSCANIILDYVFIFRLGMGMQGAALATCLAPIISMLIMSVHFISGWAAFRMHIIRPSLSAIREIAGLGLHALVTEASGGIVVMVFNAIIYRMLGNAGIAAYGVITNLGIVFLAVFAGLSGGVQPLMCRIHGKKDSEAMRYLLRLSVTTAIVLAGISYAALWRYTGGLVGVFNSSGHAGMQAIAEHGLRLYFLFLPFAGINSVLAVFFTSNELPFPSQLISLLRGAVLVVPIALICFRMHSVNGIWMTVPIAEMLTVLTGIILYARLTRTADVLAYSSLPKKRFRRRAVRYY